MKKDKKGKKSILKRSLILIFIALIVVIAWFYRNNTSQSAEVEVEKEYTSRIDDIKITFYGDGETDLPITNVDFIVQGEVEDIFIEEGQAIKTGDKLAQLDATEYEEELQLKELAYQQSKLNYEIATGDDVIDLKQDMDQAFIDYENEKINHELQIQALDKNIVDLEYQVAKLEGEYNLMLQTENQYSAVEVEDKKKSYEDTLADLNEAKANYDYNVSLYDNTLSQSKTKYEDYKKEYDQLISGESPNIKLKEIDLINAEIALEEAKDALQNTQLLSPIDGKVLYISKNIGEEVTISGFKIDEAEAGNDHFMVVQNDENPTINTVITEVDLVNVYIDQLVDVTFESIEDVLFKGKVASISSLPNIDNNGIVSYDVTIELIPSENLDIYSEFIKNGMTCSIDFILKSVEQVIQIPVDAVYVENGKQYVDVKTDNGTEKRQITTGLTDGSYVEIKDGLDVREVILY